MLPKWHLVEPSPIAAFVLGLLICGPITWISLMLILALGR